jgi:hypothetical protein
MRHPIHSFAACVVVATVLIAPSAYAQSAGPTENPIRVREALLATNPGLTVVQPVGADPVGNGVLIGALIGTGAAVATIAVMYARCDANCDAPAPAPLYLSAAGLGAGAGALAGWIIDASHKNQDRRVRLSATLTSKHQAVRVAVRF